MLDSGDRFRLKPKKQSRLGSDVYEKQRLYLRLGDQVVHLNYGQWGGGVVVEEMTSIVVGGTCLVRILFEDGQQRTFNNDLDSDMCCYYFGVRRHQHPLFDVRRPRATRSAKRLTKE